MVSPGWCQIRPFMSQENLDPYTKLHGAIIAVCPTTRYPFMSNPRALTINIEAISAEHLRKLLELALFDLDKLKEAAWSEDEGESIPLSMAGDMGSYRLEYKLGTHALIAEHQSLLGQGYTKIETSSWRKDNYSLYEHAEKAPVRLYLTSAQLTSHDAEEHEKNFLRF